MAETHSLTPAQKRIFRITWITYALFSFGRVNLSTTLPVLAVALGSSRAEVGILGTILYWTYATGQFISGEFGNHLNPRRLVAAGLLVVSIANILFSLQTSLLVMAILWGINGLAQSTGWPPLVRVIAEHLNAEQRKRTSPVLAMSYMAGTALTWAVTGFLIVWGGWQAAFYVPGLLLLVVLIAWWHSGVDAPADAEGHQRFQWYDVQAELSNLAPLLLAVFVFGFVHIGSNIWMPSYFRDTQLFPESLIGVVAGIVPLVAIAGMFLGGLLLRYTRDVLKAINLMLLVSIGGLILSISLNAKVQVLSIVITMLIIKGASGLLVASVPIIIAPPGRASSVAGSFNAALNFGGGLAGVTLGAITDHYDWGTIFWVWVGCLAVTIVLLRMTSE